LSNGTVAVVVDKRVKTNRYDLKWPSTAEGLEILRQLDNMPAQT